MKHRCGWANHYAGAALNYAYEPISAFSRDKSNDVYKKIKFKGRGSRAKNRMLKSDTDLIADEFSFQITNHLGAWLAGEKDFNDAVFDTAVDTTKQAAIKHIHRRIFWSFCCAIQFAFFIDVCYHFSKIFFRTNAMGFTHIDCFAGPGGICTGFTAAGIKTLVAIEQIKSCVDTYSANHADVHVIESDIRKVRAEEILPHIPVGGVDVVSSGMPCETFSTAGNTSRSFYDDRQFLFREGIRIAKISNAKLILFENVPAITSKTVAKNSKELIVDVLEKELDEAGYTFHKRFLLNATDYGVPQRRKRFFVLAAKNSAMKLTAPAPTTNIAVTVAEAFAGLPDVKVNTTIDEKFYIADDSKYSSLMRDNNFWKICTGVNNQLSYQTPMNHRPATLERFKLLNPGESLKTLFERYDGEERKILQQRRVLPKKMFIKRNYRLKLNEPAPTVTSHCLDEFVHPTKDRALTVRECARLQSFPDCYNFAGGPFIAPHICRDIQDKYEQIGDAVPPLMAYAWGKEIISILRGENNNVEDDSRLLQLNLF